MQRSRILAVLFMLLFSAPVAATEIVIQRVPNAQKVGEGTLSIAFWDIYDAKLYAPNGAWNPQKPFALSIRYFREIKGADIAERSIEEMKKQGFSDETLLADWHRQLLAIFPDVKDGTELVAVYTNRKATHFYHNGKHIGVVSGPLFGKHFFDIWLSEKTSEPALRLALLGQS